MADKLVIILAGIDPTDGATLSSVLTQATVAAAMEYDVEVLFTGQCDALAVEGVAENTVLNEQSGKTLLHLIREAYDAGVRFKLCPHIGVDHNEPLIEQIDETVGSAYIISEAMDTETVTFTY